MIEVVGHRGAAGILPENTIPGFEHAIALGCGATECDLRLSADGQLIICHDATVDRTTDGSGAVLEMTFDQLRALDAGGGAPLPTYDEVLATCAGRIILLSEMKAAGTPAPAVAAVRARGLEASVYFTSFQLDLLEEVRALGDDLLLAAIYSAPVPEDFDRLAAMRVSAVDVHWRNLTPEFVQQVLARGWTARGWNPNTAEDVRTTLDLGVTSVSSDYPDLALEVVRAGA